HISCSFAVLALSTYSTPVPVVSGVVCTAIGDDARLHMAPGAGAERERGREKERERERARKGGRSGSLHAFQPPA
ncbi:MAG: hypothetical protein ACPIOQ_52605, partial [Promethearchaeia archaeon]